MKCTMVVIFALVAMAASRPAPDVDPTNVEIVNQDPGQVQIVNNDPGQVQVVDHDPSQVQIVNGPNGGYEPIHTGPDFIGKHPWDRSN